MRIQSERSIRLGSVVFNHFGQSWKTVQENAVRDIDGVWVIKKDPELS